MKPWFIEGSPRLSLRDRLRLLFGVPLFIRFDSPDGECHAACNITATVQHDWPSVLSASCDQHGHYFGKLGLSYRCRRCGYTDGFEGC